MKKLLACCAAACALTACYSSNGNPDAGDRDADTMPERDAWTPPPRDGGPPRLDAWMPPIDAGGPVVDVIFSGELPGADGRVVWVRVGDPDAPVGREWRMLPIVDGRFETTFVGALLVDRFGLFLEGFIDDGDGVCEGATENPFRLFVSNDFTGDPIPASYSDAVATTCEKVAPEG